MNFPGIPVEVVMDISGHDVNPTVGGTGISIIVPKGPSTGLNGGITGSPGHPVITTSSSGS